MRPNDLPPAESFGHGTRARYVAGCRCDPCRAANTQARREREAALSAAWDTIPPNPGPAVRKAFTRVRRDGSSYEVMGLVCPGTGGHPCVAGGKWLRGHKICRDCAERASVWNGLVPASKARAHLRKLSKQGVGYKAVAEAADVAFGIVSDIAIGRASAIRASTERRILDVDAGARADGALVPAGPTHALISEILAAGKTKTWISRQLGAEYFASITQSPPREQCLAVTAMKVERIHRQLKLDLVPVGRTRVMLRELLSDFDKSALELELKVKLPDDIGIAEKMIPRVIVTAIANFYDNRDPNAVERLMRRSSKRPSERETGAEADDDAE